MKCIHNQNHSKECHMISCPKKETNIQKMWDCEYGDSMNPHRTPHKVSRTYRCKECLGKLCSVTMVMDNWVHFDYSTISCKENNPHKSWTWIASINISNKEN